ncbi:MAG: SDR family oxidoreductase [Paracoccaceae bacterium]
MRPPKNILVTGASSGIGAATAIAAAECGYDVGIGYHRDREGAEITAKRVTEKGQKAIILQADISNPDDVEEMFDRFDDELGEIGVLVNNAGIAAPVARVDQIDPARLGRMFGVNTFGAFFCARQAAIRMSWGNGGMGGVIVNVSSVAARLASAGTYVDYAASKGALDVLTMGMGREMAADRVRVVGVRPGIIDTEIHAKGGDADRARDISNELPMKRPGSAGEVADTILYLMSDRASYITATSIDVSGGR